VAFILITLPREPQTGARPATVESCAGGIRLPPPRSKADDGLTNREAARVLNRMLRYKRNGTR
jgi:hypothetical protein